MVTDDEEKELKDEVYSKLKALGVNVGAVKELNLSLSDLQEFYRKISELVGIDPNWYQCGN